MATSKRVIDLPETKGTFKLEGKVVGVLKDKFFTEKPAKNGLWRQISFGLQVSKDEVVYLSLNGGEKQYVTFYRGKNEKNGVTEDKMQVEWSKRKTFFKDGYKVVGTTIGVNKVLNKAGQEVNENLNFDTFDACVYLRDNLKDGMEVVIIGKMDYSHWKDANSGQIQHGVKLIPGKIYGSGKSLNFEDPAYKVVNHFTQAIVTSDVDPVDDKTSLISAKIVAYNSIEDATFVTADKVLAKNISKLGPFVGLTVYGDIKSTKTTDEVDEKEEVDGWGSANPMKRVTNSYKREFVVLGAEHSTINKVSYAEDLFGVAVRAAAANEESKNSDAASHESQEYGMPNKMKGEETESAW